MRFRVNDGQQNVKNSVSFFHDLREQTIGVVGGWLNRG
jgi:hypothetical protein